MFLMIRNENGKSLSPSRATTNAEGIAFLNLPEPAPENIELSYSSDEIGSCSDIGFSTAQILKTGLVAANKCNLGMFNNTATPKTGEVVVFGHRISLWERIRREIP